MLSAILRKYFQCCGRRMVAVALLFVLLVIGTGCGDVQVTIETGKPRNLYGTVVLDPYNLVIASGKVRINGPVYRETSITPQGVFSIASIPEGYYQLTADTPLGNKTQSIKVDRNLSLQVHLPTPGDLNYPLLFDISGIWNVAADANTYTIYRTSGYNMRWADGADVPIYINPGSCGAKWANAVWAYVKDWPTDFYLDRVSTSRVYTPDQARIEIHSVEEGYLADDMAGMIVATDNYGYLSKVLAYFNEKFYTFHYDYSMTVVGHELMHAIGAAHVENENSLMYPYLRLDVHTTALTTAEVTHLQYAFGLKPGQSLQPWFQPSQLNPTNPIGIMAETGSGPRLFTVITKADGRTTTTEGVPAQLRSLPVVRAFLDKESGDGMLWDMVNQ